jgi:hypothetical protein
MDLNKNSNLVYIGIVGAPYLKGTEASWGPKPAGRESSFGSEQKGQEGIT